MTLKKKWEYKEHTRVKHEILSKYLECWIRILGTFHNLNVFDCFAGRGKYTDNSEGSPLIIIKKLAEIHEKENKPSKAFCVFIEKNVNNFRNLRETVENEIEANRDKYNGWLKIEYHNNEFANIATELIEKYGRKFAPSFFFIDPFGFGGIPLNLIGDILSIEKTEIFITFMIRDVDRFHGSSSHRISIEELFGVKDIPILLKQKYSNIPREHALLKLYLNQLRLEANAEFPFPFKVNADDELRTVYYLIHCSNHPKGCESMKEIMFKTGTSGEYGYFGPAEGQLTINQARYLHELKRLLLDRFRGKSLTFQGIRYMTLLETLCNIKHYRDAVKELEIDKQIKIDGKGPRGGILDSSIITFS